MDQQKWVYILLGRVKCLKDLLHYQKIDKKLLKNKLKIAKKSLKKAQKKAIFTQKCVAIHKI